MIKRIIAADRKLFYKLKAKYNLTSYQAAASAFVKGLLMGGLIVYFFT
tara:strand:+ start:497 stop:640 length:144 start_codon:yes stop_codon:yes gene_type:complete